MILIILNMISLTAIVTQLFVLIMYSLGVLFYNYNKSISSSQLNEDHTLRTEESVEYFSQGLETNEDLKEAEFTNYDDYSAFSNDSKIDLQPSETKEPAIEENSIENIEEATTDNEKSLEEIQDSDENEGYVTQNSILTATVEDDDVEQINFNLPSEQENSITIATDEDILKVFQKPEPNDWAVRIPKAHN